jgi:two-component system, NtrC family, nitrogen regulation response regulator NtrX
MAKILVCDDHEAIRRSLAQILELENHEVLEAVDGVDAMVKVKQSNPDVIIMDIRMGRMDGMEALEKIQMVASDIPIIMISGHGDIEVAVECVKKGAFDFIAKPLDMHRLQITVRNALDRNNLVVKNKSLNRRVSQGKVQEMIGSSEAMVTLKEKIKRVATHDTKVLITGPNGAGKELVARSIHLQSPRNEKPLIEVNCAAIPSELIESELFGHMKGSFTGAFKDYAGKFEQANGGTLFLDEIGDMSLAAQAKMLRALQEGKITRIGGDRDIKVDVRVVAATNKDLEREIEVGNFREDLFHRLQVVPMEVPALNDRRSDIPALTNHFMMLHCAEMGIQERMFTDEAMDMLNHFNWTGNVRQLGNIVNRLVVMSDNMIIDADDVRKHVVNSGRKGTKTLQNLSDLMENFPTQSDFMRFVEDEYAKHKSRTV